MEATEDRIRALFSRPGLQRFGERLRERRNLGRPLTGILTLQDVSPEERRSLDQLLRRTTSRAASLRVPLDSLLRELQRANLASSWESVVELLYGPPDPTRAASVANSKAWDTLWSRASTFLPNADPAFSKWLAQLRRDGLLKRLSGGQPQQAEIWLTQACTILKQLPMDHVPIATVAAAVAGNSHALDADSSLATITLRALASRFVVPMPTSAAERRGLWSKAGIICDELSAPVLTFNLLVEHAYPLTQLLSVARAAAVPLHLSTRLLLATEWRLIVPPKRVYVCENASIIASVVRQLGAASAPIICVDGEPKTAGWLLLEHLRDAGAELLYHGDFDWKGVAIASRIIARVNAKPWRYSAADYLAIPGTELLRGSPVATPWCPALTTALAKRRIAIHEESIVDLLMRDLRSS